MKSNFNAYLLYFLFAGLLCAIRTLFFVCLFVLGGLRKIGMNLGPHTYKENAVQLSYNPALSIKNCEPGLQKCRMKSSELKMVKISKNLITPLTLRST
jgi:hypothetical protein